MATAEPLLIAHRTCPRHAPENSLEGVRLAAELGADLVELDVRRTRDGVPVLLHDPLLRRTTDHWWPLRLISARRLREVRLRGNGEPVPRLGDVLEALPPGLGVAIDIKDAGAADAVLAEVRRCGVADRVLLWSQHGRAVRALTRAAPDIEVSLLRDTHTAKTHARLLDDAVRWGARGISVHEDAATPDLIQQAGGRALRTYTWFQDLASLRTMPWTGLAGVVTDWVPEARQDRAGRA